VIGSLGIDRLLSLIETLSDIGLKKIRINMKALKTSTR
jgi:hypothetical protein